ncbi:MAG TPA: glycosyltransferase family 4 protein [Bryobacteraceae bacterium]|nr:glycosyltransferase family 4 protein [Bryobacteraceae bacterium]
MLTLIPDVMLAILTTHPIQYQVPLWQALARDRRVPFEVWYLSDHGVRTTHDPEFGRSFAWDLGQDTLQGYPHRFLKINEGWSVRPEEFFGMRLQEPLIPLMQEKGVTALWIQGWQKYAYWQAVHQARRAGVAVWMRGETNDLGPRSALLKRWAKQVRLRWLFKHVDHFFCIGSANRRFYRDYGVPEARLHWAPYFVDNERFAAQAARLRPQRMALRREWGIADDAFVALFCGKFIPKKRPLDLVAAAELLEAKRGAGASGVPLPLDSCHSPQLHLLFVGSGELGGALRASTEVIYDAEAGTICAKPAVWNLESTQRRRVPRASFAGFLNQNEIARAYVAADCLVLPSDHGETWGLVVNEAMASGLPCLVSDAVGCGEDLVAPINPILRFPLGDTAGLAASLCTCAECNRDGELARSATAHIGAFGVRQTVETVVAIASDYAWHRDFA